MKIVGTLLQKGEEFAPGEFISKDCIINADKAFDHLVSWNFEHSHPIGKATTIGDIKGNDCFDVEIEFNDEGIDFMNKVNGRFTYGIGGVAREREGNKITKFDLKEVSLISKQNKV